MSKSRLIPDITDEDILYPRQLEQPMPQLCTSVTNDGVNPQTKRMYGAILAAIDRQAYFERGVALHLILSALGMAIITLIMQFNLGFKWAAYWFRTQSKVCHNYKDQPEGAE